MGHVDACQRTGPARRPKALIVPHAGYPYSGPVAGCAYRLLRDSRASVSHVMLLGPSHRVPMRRLAVPSVDAFATPLGEVFPSVLGGLILAGIGMVAGSLAPTAGNRAHREHHARHGHAHQAARPRHQG